MSVKSQESNIGELTIEIERTQEFYKTAKILSEYIIELPLSHEDNDKLIALIADHVNAGERGGFYHGIKIGLEGYLESMTDIESATDLIIN